MMTQHKRFIVLFGFLALCVFFLSACAGLTGYPSRAPETMSADTLCYRQAYAKPSEAYDDEIAARNLDCEKILHGQTLYEPPDRPFRPML